MTTNGDAVTLSFLLNLLDGVLETPGRILVITTNHPEKLDKALVRPGRIDVNLRFAEASRQLIAEMLNNFYGGRRCVADIPETLEGVLTPAEVLECFCRHFKDAEAALADLVKRVDVGTTLDDLMIMPSMTVEPVEPMNESLNVSETSLATLDKTGDSDQKHSFTEPSIGFKLIEIENSKKSWDSDESLKQQRVITDPKLLESIESARFDSIEAVIDRTSYPPLPVNPIYEPIDVSMNPTGAYSMTEDSGDFPAGITNDRLSDDCPPKHQMLQKLYVE